jgi:LmbE family N-acetylglucosaminyl deacetylase
VTATQLDTGPTSRSVETPLPSWSSVLAVVAHPDDESFGLGAVLDAFGRAGATLAVLCLTRGESSTLHGVTGDLTTLRAAELREAARVLGAGTAILREHPDGSLGRRVEELVRDIVGTATEVGARGLLVFDPSGVTGHPDHAAATAAALRAAAELDLPVLGWTLPVTVAERLNEEMETAFVGHEPDAIDLVVAVDRERQRMACLAHASQAVPSSVLWRRLELLGDREHLRWLRHTAPTPAERPEPMMRVDHRGGDRFAIQVRGHVVTVDQPEDMGGDDTGPTPTELFVAGLVSCVAFYARRYLRRHHLDEEGLVVEASYRMGEKPARVAAVDIEVVPPASLPAERREAFMAVARHCTVHNSLEMPPEVSVGLA